jgi:hypothetical protein
MILHGDSLDKLKELDNDSVDFVCTDPPYGYSFMGKDWDKAVPSVEIWQQCLRVLKPGAFMCVMSAPRSDVQNAMISRLMEAGFRLDFTPIYWTYASGFPKAGNIGKLVDKRNGRDQDTYRPFADYLKACRTAKGYSMKYMDEQLGTNTAYSWWEGRSSGIQLPTKAYYLQLKTLLDMDSRYDELIGREEAEREILATRTKARAEGSKSALPTLGAKTEYIDVHDTAPSTDQAKALDGSYAGFQPKPAVEVIIVAMKPLSEKTYVDQALANGHGVSWLDDGRIPTGEKLGGGGEKHASLQGKEGWGRPWMNDPLAQEAHAAKVRENVAKSEAQGRFPANLLVSDDVLNDGKLAKQGQQRTANRAGGFKTGKFMGAAGEGSDHVHERTDNYGDGGSYSRYFDLDKWWKETV